MVNFSVQEYSINNLLDNILLICMETLLREFVLPMATVLSVNVIDLLTGV